MNILEYLDTKKYAMKILLIIYETKLEDERNEEEDIRINNERIWRELDCSKSTVSNRIKELTMLGMIERTELENHYPLMKVIDLTENGLRVARLLYELKNEIQRIEEEIGQDPNDLFL